MFDWLALLAPIAILAVMSLMAFVGCTVLFPFAAPDPASRFSFQVDVRFDPSLGGAFDGFEQIPPDAFDLLVDIQGMTADGEELTERVPNRDGPSYYAGDGRVGYAIDTTLPAGTYDVTCQVFAPGADPAPAIVGPSTCSVTVFGDAGMIFWAELGSNQFNPCS